MKPIDFFLQHGTFIKPFEASKTGTCDKCYKPQTPLGNSGSCVECASFTLGYAENNRISWGAVIVRENKTTRACFGAKEREYYVDLVDMIPQPYGSPLACAISDLIKNPIEEPFILATFSRDMDDATSATTQFCYPGEKLHVSGAGFRVERGGSLVDGGYMRTFDLEYIKKLMGFGIAPATLAKIVEARYFRDTNKRRKLVEEYSSLGGLPAYNSPEYHLFNSMNAKK